MGTLGCINNMMRRDKENRELRKAGKERLNETRNRLIDLNKKGHSSHLSLEQLEEIRIKTQEKEEAETHQLLARLFLFSQRSGDVLCRFQL